MPLSAISLKDLMDWIDSETYTHRIAHSDRDANPATKVYSDFVYIPRFKTAGFTAAMIAKGFLNDIELGGFSIAKYPASHPLATMTSKGGVDGANWGSTYAAMSLPHKCVWTYVDWAESLLACEAMNMKTANGLAVDDIATGTATGGSETTLTEGATLVNGTGVATGAPIALKRGSNTITVTGAGTFTVTLGAACTGTATSGTATVAGSPQALVAGANVVDTGITTGNFTIVINGGIGAKLVGDNLEIVIGAVTYYRRITAVNPVTNTITFTPKLPTGVPVAAGNAYTIKKFTMWGVYEWATLKYLCAMRYTINKLPYPKGNSSYGKDDLDAAEFRYYGRPDPDFTDAGYPGGVAKVLTGTGPNSWYHNGKPDGIWGLKGNAWQWCKFKTGATAAYTIDAGFPGQGHVFPNADGYQASLAIVGDCGIGSLALPATVGALDPAFNGNYYYHNEGALAAFIGGGWDVGARAGVFGLNVHDAATYRGVGFGFRAVA
jgi:hypothetical protein